METLRVKSRTRRGRRYDHKVWLCRSLTKHTIQHWLCRSP